MGTHIPHGSQVIHPSWAPWIVSAHLQKCRSLLSKNICFLKYCRLLSKATMPFQHRVQQVCSWCGAVKPWDVAQKEVKGVNRLTGWMSPHIHPAQRSDGWTLPLVMDITKWGCSDKLLGNCNAHLTSLHVVKCLFYKWSKTDSWHSLLQ